jgi:hypothetical protein
MAIIRDLTGRESYAIFGLTIGGDQLHAVRNQFTK